MQNQNRKILRVRFDIWLAPAYEVRGSRMVSLLDDRFERAMAEAAGCDFGMAEPLLLLHAVPVAVQQLQKTFEDFPQRLVSC